MMSHLDNQVKRGLKSKQQVLLANQNILKISVIIQLNFCFSSFVSEYTVMHATLGF